MRRALLLSLVATAACTTSGPRYATGSDPDNVPVRGEYPGYRCTKPGDGQFVGQPATQELGARMMAEARARTLRWVRFGAVVTADFNASRLTVQLDPQGRIASIRCG